MHENTFETERVMLVGVHTGRQDVENDTTDESMEELGRLVNTAGGEAICTTVQNRHAFDAATYVGEGKLEEIRLACETLEANLVVTDDELTPSQLRNIERTVGIRTIDRSALILDIFARHAHTREGKLQVEFAQLAYRLPRLAGLGIALSRLGGGIGTRGPGETKLESDRRHIRRRMDALRNELAEIQRHRDLLRQRRVKENTAIAALVGYTNAGKSTIMNYLTHAEVTAENKLFATLDPTVRALPTSDNRNAVMVDTVGFIRKLPHHLVNAFKSTLEEAALADVIVHVIDASGNEIDNQIEVVEGLLKQLGCGGKPTIALYNKCDIIDELPPRPKDSRQYSSVIYASAATGHAMSELVGAIEAVLPGKKKHMRLLIPYDQGQLLSTLHKHEIVLSEEFTEKGIRVESLIAPELADRLVKYNE